MVAPTGEPVWLPLCAAQHGVWIAHQLDPSSPRYNCGAFVEMDGPVNEYLLRRAVEGALSDAEALRVRFHDARQMVCPIGADACELLDLTDHGDPRTAA